MKEHSAYAASLSRRAAFSHPSGLSRLPMVLCGRAGGAGSCDVSVYVVTVCTHVHVLEGLGCFLAVPLEPRTPP